VHGTVVAEYQMRVGEIWSCSARAHLPDIPGDEYPRTRFRHAAFSVLDSFAEDLKREVPPADNMSVLLTHLSEVIRNNLPQLLSYKDMKALLERQDPEYRKLADEICTVAHVLSGLQAVLKLLLAERVSIRNLHLILEAVAEISPHVRRTEQIVEHVRIRMAQQICGDLDRRRRAQGAAPRQPLGSGLPPERSSATPRAKSSSSTSIRASSRNSAGTPALSATHLESR
jgi:flagellar biosynthesis protein FlhA